MAIVNSRAFAAVGCLGLLALAACSRQGQDEMTWARAALERNDRVEIVAADPQSRTFTLRMKDTGELRMVRLDQVVAGVPAAPAPAANPAGSAPQTTSTAAPAATVPPAPAGAPGSSAAETQAATAGEAAQPADSQPPGTPPAGAQPPRFTSAALRAGAPKPIAGQVLEAGPGYTIEAGSAAPASASATARDAAITNAPVELRHEPIVCQGARLLHIDNRNLQFQGDAVSAEDGCELHITNSRITATGVGVSARAANVHIDNSLIEGAAASIDASDGAQVYTTSSHFRGLSRRLDTAAVHDLGGNVWN